MRRLALTLFSVLILLINWTAQPAGAVSKPSSDVLVPYFEVDLVEPFRTSLFAVANDALTPVDVILTLHSNWGIPVLQERVQIHAEAVASINLRDWLFDGRLPTRTLTAAELQHIQAALSGQRSPKNGRYYASEVLAGRMTGYVTARIQGTSRPDALWGDYFIVCPCNKFTQGETLVNIDRGVEYEPGCSQHGIRFLQHGTALSTELMLWTARQGAVSTTPEPPASTLVTYTVDVFDEAGLLVDRRQLHLLPVAKVDIGALALPADFGWLELLSDSEFFVTAHFSSGTSSNALHSYCLPAGLHARGPGLVVQKFTNGLAAETPPGPSISVGSPILWEYIVSNNGEGQIDAIEVIDDQGVAVSCPRSSLAPGQSMTCTAHGVAEPCQYQNGVRATGLTATQQRVDASDVSHYFGDGHPEIDVEKLVNGEDADTPPGPTILAGETLNWTFAVHNNGALPLDPVTVTDDQGLTVSCPKTALLPDESMTCTATSVAQVGVHPNIATAMGTPPCGSPVVDQDQAYYTGRATTPAISLTKLTNGQDANLPPGPAIPVGEAVIWTYVATNTGTQPLISVSITDNRGVAVTCPKTSLAVGESMTCTAKGTATYGQYANVGTVTATPPTDPPITASDPSHYLGTGKVAIDIEKLTNGQDADTPPGPSVIAGTAVTWSYQVTNIGVATLTAVTVSDDHAVAVTCPKTTLAPAESMTCTASGTAIAGQYANLGTATGQAPDGPVTDTDPSHYLGLRPGIAIVKKTNGEDANTPPGPILHASLVSIECDTVTWTYLVTNTGEVPLTGITVVDDHPTVHPSCPKTTLLPGETMTCTASDQAKPGQYANVGTASGNPPSGPPVSASDPSHYFGQGPLQGCTPGYWKNHTGSWAATGYITTQKVNSVFTVAAYPTLGNATLLQALAFAGGSGNQGAAEILLRAAVAALLNASHPQVGYPRAPASVIADVNTALTGSRDAMLTLAAALDADNNRGCPLN